MRSQRIGVAAAVLVAAVVLGAGCSSSSKSPGALPPIQPPATNTVGTLPPNVARPRLPIEFRNVQVAIAATTPIKTLNGSGGSGPTQQCSTLITPRVQQRPGNPSEILFDRRRQSCYVLGSSLVPEGSVESANVKYDPITKSWATVVHFKNDVFQKNVVTPFAGKQVAVVLAGFVQSTITVAGGTAVREVNVEGGFTQAGAVEVAAVVLGIAPATVKVDTTGS